MGGELSIGTLKGTITLADQFSGPIDKIAKALGLSSESFKAVTGAAGLTVGAIGAATGAIVALGMRGADVNDVSSAFTSLSERMGSTADVMLGQLQKGTLGTVSNFDLMQMANKALGSGLVKSATDMGTLAAGAQLLADRTGGSAAEAFDTLTTAMAKGKTATLKQLGLFVDSKTAVEDYARSIHKNVADLTDHEKATALSQGTMAALRKELQAAGPPTMDFGDLIKRGGVAVQNFTDDLGMAIARSPVVMAGLKGIEDAVASAFGGSQQNAVKTLMGYVNQFAIFMVNAGGVAVEVARFITNAFTGTKVLFNAFLEALFTPLGVAISGLSDLAAKATEIPKIGTAFEGVSAGLRTAADFTKSLAFGFSDLKEKALDSAADQNAAFDAVHASLDKVGEAMHAAMGAEVDLTANSPAPALRDVADAAHLTAAEIKAIEDATRKGQEAMFDMASQGAAAYQKLQDDLTLSNLSGTDARLFKIQMAQEAELAGYQGLALNEPILYQQIADSIAEKYQQMADAAQGYFATAGAYAEAFGFKSKDEMEQAVATTLQGYMDMLASGQYTAKELKKAWEAYIKAKDELEGKSTLGTMEKFDLIAGAASGMLRSIFGKSKAAAIAAAVIDTAAAVVKTLAAYPWPWSLIPAAAAFAAGIAQVHKIESTDGSFAMGTPGTGFVDFGRESTIKVHDREAIVTPGQAESVAGMVGDELRARDQRTVAELRALRDDLRTVMRAQPILIRDAVLMAMA